MTDKARVDFNYTFLRGDASLAVNKEYWQGLSVYLPSDYVEDTAPEREWLYQCHSGTTPSHWDFAIAGGAGGATWNTDLLLNDTVAARIQSAVTEADKGRWNHWVWNFRVAWGAGGQSSPFMYVWKNGALVGSSTANYGWTAISTWIPSLNLYKGGWRNDGSYTGSKKYPIKVGLAEFRIGGSTSNYESVHPLGQSEP